jgi:adenylate cyclase class IV
MYKFTTKHIELIRSHGYQVVSDEELNLISGYAAKKADIDFLVSNKLISIDDVTGQVTFMDQEMSLEAEYGDFKAKCDLGMLYSAKRSASMMVIQLSPKIIDAADRFILLTYNYGNSLMQTFLKMHGYDYERFTEVTLWKTDKEIKDDLLKRIEFVETPSVKNIRKKYQLSKHWWVNTSSEKRTEISKCIRACMKKVGMKRPDIFYTLPKDYAKTSKGFSLKFIGNEPDKDEDGVDIESTRTFIACNARSTNRYQDKRLAVHAYNIFPNLAVKAFIQGRGYPCNDDVYALNMLLQWLFRGCIRKKSDEKMYVAILSDRMSVLFKLWLIDNQK